MRTPASSATGTTAFARRVNDLQISSSANLHLGPQYAALYPVEFQYRFNRCYDLAALPWRLLQAPATALLPCPILMSSAASLQPLPPCLPQGVRHFGCA